MQLPGNLKFVVNVASLMPKLFFFKETGGSTCCSVSLLYFLIWKSLMEKGKGGCMRVSAGEGRYIYNNGQYLNILVSG